MVREDGTYAGYGIECAKGLFNHDPPKKIMADVTLNYQLEKRGYPTPNRHIYNYG